MVFILLYNIYLFMHILFLVSDIILYYVFLFDMFIKFIFYMDLLFYLSNHGFFNLSFLFFIF